MGDECFCAYLHSTHFSQRSQSLRLCLGPSSSLSLSPSPFPSPPPSSHLSKVLSISHHSVHTADVAADDSDTAADDDCEVRPLVNEKRPQAGRQTGPTDNNREVYVSVRLATATVPADKRATSSIGIAHKCLASRIDGPSSSP